jgi:hypothetical protein
MTVPEGMVFSLAGKPFLTTREAAAHCGFKTTSALRRAKLEGRIAPVSRRGGRGTLMSSSDSLDGFLRGEAAAKCGPANARGPEPAKRSSRSRRKLASRARCSPRDYVGWTIACQRSAGARPHRPEKGRQCAL